MTVQQLKQHQYEALCAYLSQRAYQEPMVAHCTVVVTLDGEKYQIKLQPGAHCRVAVLQACRVEGEGPERRYALITGREKLRLLLELLICRARL